MIFFLSSKGAVGVPASLERTLSWCATGLSYVVVSPVDKWYDPLTLGGACPTSGSIA